MRAVCRSVEFGLRVVGIWPGMSYAILIRVLYVSLMIAFQTFQYQYLILHSGEEELTILMDALSIDLAYSLLLIKLIIFSFKTRVLNEIVEYMSEDWKKRDGTDDEHVMTRIAHVARWLCNLIISSYAMSVFLYALGTLMRQAGNNQTDNHELLLKMELPFKIESTSVYVAVLVVQFVHQTIAASMVGVLNSLLLTLVLHACGQIDIVRRKLGEIIQRDVGRDTSACVVKTVIEQHQKIISFAGNIEDLFSYVTLVQFVSNTLVICCLGFLIMLSFSIPNGSTVLVKSLLFYFVASLDTFIFCFVGEYLSTKSKMIGDTAYESLWYDLKPHQNRDLLFMIVRSQKHLTLTVGKFMDLSLIQFSNIVKASASYVSVLHAMY